MLDRRGPSDSPFARLALVEAEPARDLISHLPRPVLDMYEPGWQILQGSEDTRR